MPPFTSESEPQSPAPSSGTEALGTDRGRQLREALAQRFGHDGFRAGQERAAVAILEGRDVVAVMPTGAGKSLCYQLPAVLLPGTTVVISPLIALMKDQVDALRRKGIAAAAIHSGLTASEKSAARRDLAAGRLDLVYVAPERLPSSAFRSALAQAGAARLIIDEAHCISAWGHDFRPDYRRLGALRQSLGVPVGAFTATATPVVRHDIRQQLGMDEPLELVTGFERPNLTLAVQECRSQKAKARELRRVVEDMGTPGIVYASTRKGVELWGAVLERLGLRAACYHAGLGDGERRQVQDAFLGGELDAIAATNAFGMGVDKADIRFVVHADLPGSLEAYYQEAGRAGRDGEAARCVLLYAPSDIRTQEFFLAGSNPDAMLLRTVWQQLGQGLGDGEIEGLAGREASRRMAASTASRLLRQVAEDTRQELGQGPLPLDLDRQAEKARRDRHRLDAVVRYATADLCRSAFIYRYFATGDGEPASQVTNDPSDSEETPSCGTCDICLGWRQQRLRPLSDEEHTQARIALSGVARLDGRFGVERIAQMLTGSRAQPVLKFGLQHLPTYGKLSQFPMARVKELLAALTDARLLERQPIPNARAGAFVLALTAQGQEVMHDRARAQLSLPEPQNPRPDSAPQLRSPRALQSPDSHTTEGPQPPTELVERLQAWRREESQRREVPAYVVFNNRTLDALALARPTTVDQLLDVPGIGPTKAERYGEALIELLTAKPEGSPQS